MPSKLWIGIVVVLAGIGGVAGTASARTSGNRRGAGVIEKVRVSHVTASGATLEAVFDGDAEYEFRLLPVEKCGPHEKCKAPHSKVVSEGTVPGATTVLVDIEGLGRGSWEFWVETGPFNEREEGVERSKAVKFHTRK